MFRLTLVLSGISSYLVDNRKVNTDYIVSSC